MERKEGAYLSSLASTFGMKHSSYLLLSSFNVKLSTFLKPCVPCLLEAPCYSSSGVLPSSRDGMSKKMR